ncbi:protein NUCLEAR FUSION DEFECTIVE 4-like [Forsythia ovata]|uniref:Protein NUCLEAR FUSION DEFECTIVE 4-like n=1 Tax=Forsythia ovata TaxID=205694 RepID=A0ABD1RKJ3_9LAMI
MENGEKFEEEEEEEGNLRNFVEESVEEIGVKLMLRRAEFCFFGRLIPSVHDYFFSKSKYMVSRPAAMACMIIPMCGAFVLLVNKQDIWLYISTAIIGICTGAITTISVSTTTQLFGTKNFGVNHNILVSNIPIGSFLFGDFAALLYSTQKLSGQDNCIGHKCYQTYFHYLGIFVFSWSLSGFRPSLSNEESCNHVDYILETYSIQYCSRGKTRTAYPTAKTSGFFITPGVHE